jgi:uncharacterized phiE125 gp8 family phage protein
MPLAVITPPLFEPVSLLDAKRWLLVDEEDTNHDAVINQLIKTMRAYAENRTLRAFIPREYRYSFPAHSGYAHACCNGYDAPPGIELPFPPGIEVSEVAYVALDGTRTVVDAASYYVNIDSIPALIMPIYGGIWPSSHWGASRVEITYKAGYTADENTEAALQAAIPENVRVWMQARLATLFDNREQIVIGTIVTELQHNFCDGLIDDLIIGNRLF